MVFDDLQDRYGSYLAEMVRQVMTLDEFRDVKLEEVLPFLETRTERLQEEYRQSLLSKEASIEPLRSDYREILQRRWQDAEELEQKVASAEAEAREVDYLKAVGA